MVLANTAKVPKDIKNKIVSYYERNGDSPSEILRSVGDDEDAWIVRIRTTDDKTEYSLCSLIWKNDELTIDEYDTCKRADIGDMISDYMKDREWNRKTLI